MATEFAGFTIACFLCLTGGAALKPATDRPGGRQPQNGEELWNLGIGCPKPASDFEHPPPVAASLEGRWESDRAFYRKFLAKAKPSLRHDRFTPHSTWEATTAALPSANKLIYFVNADGDLSNCTRCLDCRLTKNAREKAKNITKDNPDLEQAELVITSPMTRAMDTAMDAFPGKPLLLDARLIELAGIAVKGKGQNVLNDHKAHSLLPEYNRLWGAPYNQRNAQTQMRTPYFLMSPPAGKGNSSVERLAKLRTLMSNEMVNKDYQHFDRLKVAPLAAERQFIISQLDAEELPDARFGAVIKDLWHRPEGRIVVVSHHNLLHIGLGEKLSERHVTRRYL